MALAFSPSAWFNQGPFAFQLSRPLHYALYFFAGVAIGANSIERGLLVTNGPLARHWPVGLTAALASLLFWMGITGVTMADGVMPSLGLQILADLSFVLACFASCFAVLAIVLRFAAKSLPKLAGLRNSAYGMYLIHYLFVVWLQYALLKAALPATIKGGVVFTGTLLLSWGVIAALRRVPPVAQIIGADRARGVPAS
jgi:surface polysaccharide O-acyltransferase-like enzyme